ncbi:hypothetical protein ACFYSC_30390 [Streptosporangium sp. NPDC004379]|uniref:hypothetical protein n=1 Tax=Streptosporangium sp. NPDC004379 TaxID=3366189 RepID=UPI0036926A76
MSRTSFFSRYGRLTIFMIPIGIAINFVGGQLALLLKLPVYLDSIGTVLVGALCGGIPGAFVGLVSNGINSITSPPTLAFGVLSVMFGLLAGWLGRRGVFTVLWKALASAIPFALIGGFLGALLTLWAFGGLAVGGGALVVGVLMTAGLDVTTANFVAQVPMDFLDKVPTMLMVYMIIRGIPQRIFAKLPLGGVYLRAKGVTSAPVFAASRPTGGGRM